MICTCFQCRTKKHMMRIFFRFAYDCLPSEVVSELVRPHLRPFQRPTSWPSRLGSWPVACNSCRRDRILRYRAPPRPLPPPSGCLGPAWPRACRASFRLRRIPASGPLRRRHSRSGRRLPRTCEHARGIFSHDDQIVFRDSSLLRLLLRASIVRFLAGGNFRLPLQRRLSFPKLGTHFSR